MFINDREINTISEAWDLLPEELKQHSLRVAQYTKLVFRKIVQQDMFYGAPYSDRDLDYDNTEFFYNAGLYHDIGKLLPDEESLFDDEDDKNEYLASMAQNSPEGMEPYVPKEHTIHGREIFLGTMRKDMKATERNIIVGGIAEHHERMDGKGVPYGKLPEKLTYSGRIVAAADILDHIALTIVSEDPIGDALKRMKPLTADNTLDPVVYAAFIKCRAALRKTFSNGASDESVAIPETDTWIKRKSTRPMELVFKKAEFMDADIYIADMRFKDTKANTLCYEDVKSLFKAQKALPDLAQYFTYEFMDSIQRLRTCSVPVDAIYIYFPDDLLKVKNYPAIVKEALEDEGVTAEGFAYITNLQHKNVDALREMGFTIIEEPEFDTYAVLKDDDYRHEDDIVREKLAHMQKEQDEDN